ncbi:MAG TPA: hypothetical protein VEB86_03320 [Chryseosolibacter sp.]|nr:hypothetical protein [Chryseosolibacter sp.]
MLWLVLVITVIITATIAFVIFSDTNRKGHKQHTDWVCGFWEVVALILEML